MQYISAVPAYGRDYKSKKEVLADWDAGKDFLAQTPTRSGYISKSDVAEAFPGGVTINIRYKRLTMIAQVIVKPAPAR